MNRIFLLSQILILFLLVACTQDPAGANIENEIISRESALELVKQEYLGTDSTIAIYFRTDILSANTEITFEGYILDTPIVDYKSWFFYVNVDYPDAEIPSEFDYVFVNPTNGHIEIFRNWYPPSGYKSYELLYPARQTAEPLSRQEALDLLLNQAGEIFRRSAIFADSKQLSAGDTLFLMDRDKYYTFSYFCWVFFIDGEYIVNDKWPHWCKFAFVDSETGFIQMFRNVYQPENYSQMDTVYAEWESQNYQIPVLSFSGNNNQRGCGDIRVYIENDDQNVIVNIKANEDSLSLGVEWKEFDLTNDFAGLDVYIDFYYYLQPNYWSMRFNYCNDVVGYVRPPKKWFAVSGSLKIAISDDNLARLIFNNVRFVDVDGGNEVIISLLEVSDIPVRFYPG